MAESLQREVDVDKDMDDDEAQLCYAGHVQIDKHLQKKEPFMKMLWQLLAGSEKYSANCNDRISINFKKSEQERVDKMMSRKISQIDSSLSLPYFIGMLKDYQIIGVRWLKTLSEHGVNGILADEMGLGKTIQVIALICNQIRKIKGPFLIVVPLSTLSNWGSEFERFAPQIPVVLYHGNKQERVNLMRDVLQTYKVGENIFNPVVIITAQMVALEITTFSKITWKYLIVDDGHCLKNHNAQISKNMRRLKCLNKLILTGTPLQNNMKELWSLLNFIMPHIFENMNTFESLFLLEDFGDNSKIVQDEESNNIISSLHKILRPFMLRRLKSDVLMDLVPKKEVIVYCPLTSLQRNMYMYTIKKNIDGLTGIMKNEEEDKVVLDGSRPKRKCTNKDKNYVEPDSGDSVSDCEKLKEIQEVTGEKIEKNADKVVLDGGRPRRKCTNKDKNYVEPDSGDSFSDCEKLKEIQEVTGEKIEKNADKVVLDGGRPRRKCTNKDKNYVEPDSGDSVSDCEKLKEIQEVTGEKIEKNADKVVLDGGRPRRKCTNKDKNYVEPDSGDSFSDCEKLKEIQEVTGEKIEKNADKVVLDGGRPRRKCTNKDKNYVEPDSGDSVSDCEKLKEIQEVTGEKIEKNADKVVLDGGRPRRKCTNKDKNYVEPDSDDSFSDCEKLKEIQEVTSEKIEKSAVKYFNNITMASPMMMFRKIVNHPYLIHAPITPEKTLVIDERLITESGKMLVLDKLLEKLKRGNHKVLIFSTMVMLLDLIEEVMILRGHTYCRLDGKYPLSHRTASVNAFNSDPSIFAFLISVRAGSVGLNLTGADTVIIFDSDWNPQVDIQAQDQCHRIGQTKPVIVYSLITKNTVDDKILQYGNMKKKLAKVVTGKFTNPTAGATDLNLNELLHMLEKDDSATFIHPNIFSHEEWEKLLDRSDLYAQMEGISEDTRKN